MVPDQHDMTHKFISPAASMNASSTDIASGYWSEAPSAWYESSITSESCINYIENSKGEGMLAHFIL